MKFYEKNRADILYLGEDVASAIIRDELGAPLTEAEREIAERSEQSEAAVRLRSALRRGTEVETPPQDTQPPA